MLTGCDGSSKLRVRNVYHTSPGEYWEYSMSPEHILRETDKYERYITIGCGSIVAAYWEFEAVGQGEVTIDWIMASGGDNIQTSYSVTYFVDENGKITEKSDSRNS